MFKIVETDAGIKRGQIMTKQHLESSSSIKLYFRNASLKLNVRSDGINHVVRQQTLPLIGQVQQCDTMIIGADATYPNPGSVGGTPSIAAVVGSIDKHFARFVDQMRLNESGKDVIGKDDMEFMVRELLNAWSKEKENDGRIPPRILFYRDGVGDSQYAKIRETEIASIRRAWQEFRKQKMNPMGKRVMKRKEEESQRPKPTMPSTLEITAFVVTKRHHTRLYPNPIYCGPDGDGKFSLDVSKMMYGKDATMTNSRNCFPGTVVDSVITSPYYFDFFLLSYHVPKNSGTARPTHYFVMKNEMNFTPQQLQDLTFMMCFIYCRSTSSVSYVPATYYADKLCECGRLYLQPFVDRAKDLREKKLSPSEMMAEAKKDFYSGGGRGQDRVGQQMNPWHKKLDGKMFWL